MLRKLFDHEQPMRLAIFMSGSGSNAEKIIEEYLRQREEEDIAYEPVLMFTDNPDSSAYEIAIQKFKKQDIVLPIFCNPIKEFCENLGYDINNMDARAEYDCFQSDLLDIFGIDAIALAGYDWVVTDDICNGYLTVNVHPGDLRERDENGKRKYTGLGWIPSAKAILDGKDQVYTSVHLVTEELDGGPLLAVSKPQNIAEWINKECPPNDRSRLLGHAKYLSDISRFINDNSQMDDWDIRKKFRIYGTAADCQERLKLKGDWIEFPKVLTNIAKGRYSENWEDKTLYFDEQPIPDGVVNMEE